VTYLKCDITKMKEMFDIRIVECTWTLDEVWTLCQLNCTISLSSRLGLFSYKLFFTLYACTPPTDIKRGNIFLSC